MRTTNPALNDKIFAKETPGALRAGWASPAPDTLSPWPPASPTAERGAPAGSLDTDRYRSMRMGGVVSASAVLLLLVVVAGWFGWQAVTVVEGTDAVTGDRVVVDASIPAWVFGAAIAGFLLAIVTIFLPKAARFTSPLYAVAEGVFLGAISHYYELSYDGIVLQAVGLTVGVFATMLLLFATRVIKVTRKFMIGVMAATGAVALVYLASFVVRLLGSDIPFIHDAGPLGIGFSLAVVVIAALNLVLDFDFIERGVAMQAPRHMEWYAAFGLLVTLVWLYLELLRLLSKLRSR